MQRSADGSTELVQRYYSPGTGRFLTSDPYLASGGASAPSSWNRYAYVEGDPVNHIDPQGLFIYIGGEGPPRFGTPFVSWDDIFGPRRNHDEGVERPLTTPEKTEALRQMRVGQAVSRVSDRITKTDCAGLFLDPESNTPENRVALSRKFEKMWDDGLIRVLSPADAGGSGSNVPAFTTDTFGIIYLVDQRIFFTGMYEGKPSGSTQTFNGLTKSQTQESILIHEFIRWMGVAGPDAEGQGYRLPNGQRVDGSAGISAAVLENCFK